MTFYIADYFHTLITEVCPVTVISLTQLLILVADQCYVVNTLDDRQGYILHLTLFAFP